MKASQRTLKSDRGANMVEYGLMVAVVALVALASIALLGEKTDQTFTTIAVSLDEDGTGRVPGDSSGESGEPGDPADPGDPGDPADPGDPGDPADPGDGDDQGQNLDDDESQDQQANDDDSNGGSDNDADTGNGGSDDNGNGGTDDEVGEPGLDVSALSVVKTDTSVDWMGNPPKNYHGEWAASVEFANRSDQTQLLTVIVKMIEENGETTTQTVEGLELPANGSATFTQRGIPYRHLGNGNNVSGTKRVEIQVVSITVTGSDNRVHTVDVDSEPIGIDVPRP